MNIAIIVCHTLDGVIGNNGRMPWHLPKDLKRFKHITLNHPIIMGRKTFQSLPNQKPLPQRQNIILSRSGFTIEGCETAESIAHLNAFVGEQECFVIGGHQIYQLFMPHAHRIYRTVLETHIDGDAYFPDFDSNHWQIVKQELCSVDQNHPYPMRFEILDRIHPHCT